jgi:hypothetical protein
MIRPNLLRAALAWLRENNPLCEKVTISEEILAGLTEDGSYEEPTLRVDGISHSHRENVNDAAGEVELDEGEDSFELRAGETSSLTEDDIVMVAIQNRRTESGGPTVRLEKCADPINEYTTSTLMQLCFPSLFRTGTGGHQATTFEKRMHTYDLAEFCTHLVRWHDRRFVIHRNFKFFCLNMVQRRQVDGLTRRLHQRRSGSRRDTQAKTRTDHSDDARDQPNDARAREILRTVKP